MGSIVAPLNVREELLGSNSGLQINNFFSNNGNNKHNLIQNNKKGIAATDLGIDVNAIY